MKKSIVKWIVIGAGAILFIFVTVYFIISMINRTPNYAFKRCFGFPLPEGSEIVTCKVETSILQGKPSYAFEVILSEEQYAELTKKLELFQDEEQLNSTKWNEENGDFFSKIESWRSLHPIDWKETNPKKLFAVSTGYNVGYDLGKQIHILTLMVSEEPGGVYRMYIYAA